MAEQKNSNGQTYGSPGRPNHPVKFVPDPPKKIPLNPRKPAKGP